MKRPYRRGPLARAAWTTIVILVAGFWWKTGDTGAPPAPVHFDLASVPPTPLNMTVAGYLTVEGGGPGPGAEIAAYDPERTLCGVTGVDPASGAFILHIYGDDDTTVVDEGARDGEDLTLVVYTTTVGEDLAGATIWSAPLPRFTDKGSFRRDGFVPGPPDEDRDGDGWADTEDAFPEDSAEWLDTDGDGTGNNADPDDDGDGFTDVEEADSGSDPLDGQETPRGLRPLAPIILEIVADRDAPLTTFTVALSEFSDPDAAPEATPTGVTWAIGRQMPVWDICEVEYWLAAICSRLTLSPGLLDPGATYLVRARYTDAAGLASDWSPPYPLTTGSDPLDGGDDGVEDRAFVTGLTDLDSDDGVVVFREPETGALVELIPGAGRVERLYVNRGDELSADHLPDVVLPYGLYSFRLAGLPPGQTEVELLFRFPAPLPTGSGWVKTDPVTGTQNYSDRVRIVGNQAALRLTDGGAGDADGVVNGIIVDPGGPALFPAEQANASGGGGGGGCFYQALGSAP